MMKCNFVPDSHRCAGYWQQLPQGQEAQIVCKFNFSISVVKLKAGCKQTTKTIKAMSLVEGPKIQYYGEK